MNRIGSVRIEALRSIAVIALVAGALLASCGGVGSLTPADAGQRDAGARDAAPDASGEPDAPPSASCPAGQLRCAGGCTDVLVDGQNCGGCGVACAGGQVCAGGACSTTCGAALARCTGDAGDYCANLQTDSANCGSCDKACPSGRVCSGGGCQISCGAPFVQCGSACTDTEDDPNNCGDCGAECGPFAHATVACVGGSCREICASGYLDCSATGTSGCNTDSQNDPDNCNGCGRRCGPFANATAECVAGKCSYSCDGQYLDCDGQSFNGCEADPATDSKNCGSCGHVCSTGCTSGACRSVTALGANRDHTCAALSDGSLWCWGSDGQGEIGDGQTSGYRLVPTRVGSLTGVTGVAAGMGLTCAVTSGGSLYCWGYGDLGDGTTSEKPVPTVVPGLGSVTAVTAGGRHVCALLSGGSVDCWGHNEEGQLGDGTTTEQLSPKPVPGLSGVTAIAAGYAYTCALASGTVECWGINWSGQLGDDRAEVYRPEPGPVLGLPPGVTKLGTGSHQACVVLSDGTVDCWGDAGWSSSLLPEAVSGVAGAVSVAVGGDHACARLSDGSVTCWGSDDYGQVGDGRISGYGFATVLGLGDVTLIAAGDLYSCAASSLPSLHCWGLNAEAQLGNGSIIGSASPVLVSWR